MNQPGEREERGAEDRSGKPRVFGYAFLVASGIFLSRLFGLVRERAISHYMGTSPAAGAFKAALRIPNLLQNLFGEGVLSASFIPVYAKLIAEHDEETAGRVAGATASILTLIVSGLVLIGVLASPLLVSAIAPGFTGDIRDLTIVLVRILFPGAGILVLSAWCLGVLNSHRRFFIPYVAPVLWNTAMIATLVIFGTRLRLYPLAEALAWGTVAGSVLQFGIQIPFVLRVAPRLRFRAETALAPVREVIRNFVPVVMGRGAVQLSAFVDEIIVSFLGASAFASLTFAQTLYMLPVSLFGMSIAASELPQMSSVTGDPRAIHEAIRPRLSSGLRQIMFFVVPTVVAFILIGDLLVAALYQTGRFGTDDKLLVWYIVAVAATGLLGVTLGRLYSNTFYALKDAKTPLKFAVVRVTISALVAWLLAIPLRELLIEGVTATGLPIPRIAAGVVALGVLGVAFGSSLGGWIEMLLLRRTLHARIGVAEIGIAFQIRVWSAALLSGLVAMVVGRPFAFLVQESVTARWGLDRIGAGIAICLIFGISYFVLSMLLGIEQAKRVVGRMGIRW